MTDPRLKRRAEVASLQVRLGIDERKIAECEARRDEHLERLKELKRAVEEIEEEIATLDKKAQEKRVKLETLL